VFFALLPLQLYWAALVVFVVAAGTDWVDGWYARKYNMVTKLGRVLDPFCDKILICGAYILLGQVGREIENGFSMRRGRCVLGCVSVETCSSRTNDSRNSDVAEHRFDWLDLAFDLFHVAIGLGILCCRWEVFNKLIIRLRSVHR